MFINNITLKNFRCFSDRQFSLDGRFIIITGNNGTGKTSLLEALYYSCYLKSFRTRLNKELVSLEKNHFFVQVDYTLSQSAASEQIQIGFSEHEGKIVKRNKKTIISYKDLIDHFNLVSMTADDLKLVSGMPAYRREFLNYSLLQLDSAFISTLKKYKKILEQRNSLLHSSSSKKSFVDQLFTWTQKIWEESHKIRVLRKKLLQSLEKESNFIFNSYINKDGKKSIKIDYIDKNQAFANSDKFNRFWELYEKNGLREQEIRFKRSLIGCHLDDFSISLFNKKARIFASRGQQKLLTLLIKIALLKHLKQKGREEILLLDDFLTDFDEHKVKECFNIIKSLDLQVFITVPTQKVDTIVQLAPKDYFQIDL